MKISHAVSANKGWFTDIALRKELHTAYGQERHIQYCTDFGFESETSHFAKLLSLMEPQPSPKYNGGILEFPLWLSDNEPN